MGYNHERRYELSLKWKGERNRASLFFNDYQNLNGYRFGNTPDGKPGFIPPGGADTVIPFKSPLTHFRSGELNTSVSNYTKIDLGFRPKVIFVYGINSVDKSRRTAAYDESYSVDKILFATYNTVFEEVDLPLSNETDNTATNIPIGYISDNGFIVPRSSGVAMNLVYAAFE